MKFRTCIRRFLDRYSVRRQVESDLLYHRGDEKMNSQCREKVIRKRDDLQRLKQIVEEFKI
jgi:hypothetical protein